MTENQKQKELVHAVLHDLKPPVLFLEYMAGHLSASANNATPGDAATLLQAISTFTQTSKKIFDWIEILDNRYQVPPTVFSLNRLLQDCTRETGEKLAAMGNKVTFHGEELTISANEKALGRILTNLLENAIQNSSGSDITVQAQREGNKLLLSVTDHGSGLPAQVRENILEAFHQRTEKILYRYGYRIIIYLLREMGGEISFGEAEKGTRVLVKIPVGS